MKYICPKNFHWFIPVLPIFYINKRDFTWKISFDNTCIYNLGDNDQYDWNKLVGISEYLNPRKSSVRLVWRYNLETKLIEIGYYIEKNYKVESEILYSVEPNKEIEVGITFNYTSTIIRVDKNFRIVDFILNKELTFRNNPYFGGNKKSPHKIKLKIK